MPVYFRERIIEPHRQTFYEHSQEEQVFVNRQPVNFQVEQQNGGPNITVVKQPYHPHPPYSQQHTQILSSPGQFKDIKQNGNFDETHREWRQQTHHPVQGPQPTEFQQVRIIEKEKPTPFFEKQQSINTTKSYSSPPSIQQTLQTQVKVGSVDKQQPLLKQQNDIVITQTNQQSQQNVGQSQQIQQSRGFVNDQQNQQYLNVQAHDQQTGIFIQSPPPQKTSEFSAGNRYEEHMRVQQSSKSPHQDFGLGDFKYEFTRTQPSLKQPPQTQPRTQQTWQVQDQLSQSKKPSEFGQEPLNIGVPTEHVINVQAQQNKIPLLQVQKQPQTVQIQQHQQQRQEQQQQRLPFYHSMQIEQGEPGAQMQSEVQYQSQQQRSEQSFPSFKQYEQQKPGTYVIQQQKVPEQPIKTVQQPINYPNYPQGQKQPNEKQEESVRSSVPLSSERTLSQQQRFVQQPTKIQPPSPITQIDFQNDPYYQASQQNEYYRSGSEQPDAFYRSWTGGGIERSDYYVDIPTGPPFAFTTQGSIEDRLLEGDRSYAIQTNLDRRRAESEQRRRHDSPVSGAAEYGYKFGGMNFADNMGFDPSDASITIDLDTHRRTKSLERGVPRRPNDFFGLDYSVIPPGERPRDYAMTDIQQEYHGYQPLPPRKQCKYNVDPHAPLNIAEAEGLEALDSSVLIGNTLSNQKILNAVELPDEEKVKFCAEFAPPQGFKPEHRTVIPEPKPEEPICFSTSAKKPQAEAGSSVGVNPFKSDVDSGWYTRDGQGQYVWNRHSAWENQAHNLDSRAYLPSWAKIPPQIPPPWVKRSNTFHNVWQTAADRGYIAQSDNYNTGYQQLVDSDVNQKQGIDQSGEDTSQPILVDSTDNAILPAVALSTNVTMLKPAVKTLTGKYFQQPTVIVTRNPFAAVEPIFSKGSPKNTQVYYSGQRNDVSGDQRQGPTSESSQQKQATEEIGTLV